MQTKQCQICGKTFMLRWNNQKYCSAHCSKVAQKALERLWRQQHNDGDRAARPPVLKNTKCLYCGKIFSQSFVNEKFCSDSCRLQYFEASPLWHAI